MLRNITLLSLFIVFLISPTIAAKNWKLEKNESGIKVYTRSVPGSELKEFRGEIILKNTRLAAVIALSNDVGSYTKWIHNCIKAEVLQQKSINERITYIITKTPWPTSNRDSISKTIASQDKKTLTITAKIIGMANFRPKTKDNVRVPKMTGFWKFIPLKPGGVKVIYQLHSEPGGSLPNWLANAFVVDMPFNSLKMMRKMVKQPKYKNAKAKGFIEPK